MTDTVRVPRGAVEAIADDLRAISLELTKKRATTPVSEDIFRKALALEAMLAASPQGEGSSADAMSAEPIGDDGQFEYRTTIMGERHIVHVATGFVWFKLPYDYRYTDNASQRRNAETMLAALLGHPPHPDALPGDLRERVAWQVRQLGTDVWVDAANYSGTAPYEVRALYAHPAPIKPFGDTGELREKVARLAWTYSCSSEPFDPEADHGWSRALDLYANDPRYTRTRSSTDFVDRTWAFADAILDLIQSERLNK